MVIFSRKVDYGILALCYLMRQGEEVSASKLADFYGLSRPFIANILKLLRQQGFLESQRGIMGGYRLAKDPGDITLKEVVTAIDGPFRLLCCVEDPDETMCDLVDTCPISKPLLKVHDQLLATLAETTIEDLGTPEPSMILLSEEIRSDG